MDPTPGVDVWPGPLSSPLHLPLRDASVDAVLCFETYDQLVASDRTALIAEALRVLRPGGLFAVWAGQVAASVAEFQPHFEHVTSLVLHTWRVTGLVPVSALAEKSGTLLRSGDALPEAARVNEGLVIASSGDLSQLVSDCSVIPVVLDVAVDVPKSGASPTTQSMSLDDGEFLDALFDAPSSVASVAPPAMTLPSAARGEADLELLRQEIAAVTRERDGLRDRAATLSQELRHAHAQAIDAGAELHELRRRVEGSRVGAEEASAPLVERAAGGLDDVASMTRVLADDVEPIVTTEPARPSADVISDRDRLREELVRRTAELQACETELWQREEEVQRERLENVRLVTDVDRLREQVDRSQVVEHERMQEIERLGHDLRRLELAHAELQGAHTTLQTQFAALEEIATTGIAPPVRDLQVEVFQIRDERDQAQARERAANELVRRREREVADANRTVRELRRNVEEHASIAANLRGELAVLQVEAEQFGTTVPHLKQRLRELQQQIREREEEVAEIQRRLEDAVAEQQQLRERVRRYKQEIDTLASARDTVILEHDRLRGELDAKRRAVEQLQRLVALGTGSSGAERDALAELRALLVQQASEHAEQLAQHHQQEQRLIEAERERLQRVVLEAAIRGEEQEYLLYQLDTAEQRIWEMTDATDRSAARLAAGLAQLDKQKEQYEDVIDQLEVARTLLAEAQAHSRELERQLASERAKLARMTMEPEDRRVAVHVHDDPDDELVDPNNFDMLVVHDEDSGMEVAPALQHDMGHSDALDGIDFDDDEAESLAVRLAGGSAATLDAALPVSTLQIDLDDGDDDADDDDAAVSEMLLPSDERVQIDFEEDFTVEDDEGEDLEIVSRPPTKRPTTLPKVLRTLPFLEDDDEEELFSIDTDAIEIATPTPAPPTPDRPGFDQKLTDHSNARIVIEVLEDEAWPDEDSGKV